jgi:hypothetical protein
MTTDEEFDTTWTIERELQSKGIYREHFNPGQDKLWDVTTQPHYTAFAIQPIDYINANEMDFLEGNVVKYVTRWRHKNGIEDLEKLVDCAKRLLAREKAK